MYFYVRNNKGMIREKIEELRRTLDYHNHKYYVENSPEISDREFDVLMRELQELEAAHPEYADGPRRKRSHDRIPKRRAPLSDAFAG